MYACIVPFMEAMKQYTAIDIDDGGVVDHKEFFDYATKCPNQILVEGEINDMFEKVNKAKTGNMIIDKFIK